MNAIILAAGMGKRLKEFTRDNTKCMVKVNGVTLIERMLSQLDKQNLDKIVIVVGYRSQHLIDYISTLDVKTPIVYVENPIYDKTNNIYSLYLASDYLCEDDTLLFESDLIFEDGVIEELVSDPRPTLALVDKYEAWMDGTCVKISADDTIDAFISGKKLDYDEVDEYYKTVNIYKFSKNFSKNCYVPFLKAYSSALGNNEYYEQVLRVITMLDETEIRAKRLSSHKWYEIDDVQDLDIASSMFTTDPHEKVKLLQSRFGGYWRYPKLIDFCYLVNPYYPPKRMIGEIKNSFETLLCEYPSGMRVNSLLAAKNFGVQPEEIVVGNGAAELIKAMMESLVGKTGFIRPTFEEYPNRFLKEESVVMMPETDGFRYNADDVISYFCDKDVSNLVIVNPDNPTGNYIPRADVLRLIDWAAEMGIKLIIDESFVDFSEENSTLIDSNILAKNPHLVVVKSISKSYGVPGLRLGVLASGDAKLIADIKRDVAIWNINSFGEFYMQIAEKYKSDYVLALKKFKEERRRFVELLSSFKSIRVFPSEANYLLIELCGISAEELTKNLLINDDILVKDLTQKLGGSGKEFMRIAIRNTEDNDKLIEALRKYLS
ncbi:MAG: aminotransferase class I/II-fold pyridoxal phosphate-dependent enzyme [Clostridia bacterium]|nr:aminotransferase class I/II-fold pyridoxal phosphate-dependent enzyme [Clostridia bacterium]